MVKLNFLTGRALPRSMVLIVRTKLLFCLNSLMDKIFPPEGKDTGSTPVSNTNY